MGRRLTLIAGSGALVPLVLASAHASGIAVQIIDLVARRDLQGEAVLRLPVSQAQTIVDAVRTFGSTDLVLVGGIILSDGDREAIAGALGFAGRMARSLGDLGLATALLAHFRLAGVRVLGAHQLVGDLLVQEGLIAGPPASAALIAHGRRALMVARAIGRLDLGQAVVVSGDRPIAAEDAGGTDALLQRVAQLRELGHFGDGAAPLILAKALKPRQPKFVDLPTIGPETIVKAAEAGIAAVIVEAKRSLVLERSSVHEQAISAGITVLGLLAS